MIYLRNSIDLVMEGPIIPVTLAPPAPTALPLEVLAIIETTYPFTFIQEGVATELGLTPHRWSYVTTPTKYFGRTDVYYLNIQFPSGHSWQLEVFEVPYMAHTASRVKCIIGRNLLANCVFKYDGPRNAFSLEFKE